VASVCSRNGICLKAKEEEAIEMALPWLRGKVDTGRYCSTGGAKKSKRAIKLPVSPDR
jgi:hypothetical protein